MVLLPPTCLVPSCGGRHVFQQIRPARVAMLSRHDEAGVVDCDVVCEDVRERLPVALREILRHFACYVLITLRVTPKDPLRTALELRDRFVDPVVSGRVPLALEIGEVRNQSRPTRQTVLARDDALGVGEGPVLGISGAGPREVRAGTVEGVGIACAQRGAQGLGLFPVELDAWVRRERADAGHAASFRIGQRPHGWPEKRDGERLCSNDVRWDTPFPRTGGALRGAL